MRVFANLEEMMAHLRGKVETIELKEAEPKKKPKKAEPKKATKKAKK